MTHSEGRIRWPGSAGIDKDFTVVYVARMWGTIAGRVLCATYPGGGNLLFGWWTDYQDIGYVTGPGFFLPDVRKPWDTKWQLYSADAAVASYVPRLLNDGVFLSEAQSVGAEGFNNTLNLSGYGDITDQETCDCEVAEVIIYDRKLSEPDRKSVEDYLRVKWMSVPADVVASPADTATGSDTHTVLSDDVRAAADVAAGTDALTVTWNRSRVPADLAGSTDAASVGIAVALDRSGVDVAGGTDSPAAPTTARASPPIRREEWMLFLLASSMPGWLRPTIWPLARTWSLHTGPGTRQRRTSPGVLTPRVFRLLEHQPSPIHQVVATPPR